LDLAKLNPPQREAVTTIRGPVLVLAGAGSGKTRVITHRIAHLIEEGVPAREILAVTFTNKAAAEMKERVVKLAGKAARSVWVSTFHAFGAEVLREEIFRLGWPKRFAIADAGDQTALVRRAMRERSVDERAFDARKVLTAISRAKNAGITPTPKEEGLGDDYDLITAEVFPLYQLGLKAQGAVDFDDLVVLPCRVFEELPEVRRAYQLRYRYLLVDEFQDTNQSQLRLLKHLAGEAMNVCAVGDDDQCIYSWRGAEVKNILQFDRFFPGGREVRLEQNYRSLGNVLHAANGVIEKNPERKLKRMWTDRHGGDRLRLVVCPTEEDEARFVAREISRLQSEGVPASDMAVLFRTNGQSRPVEEALREKEISYEVVGGSEFFDRREVKDVLAYLKVLVNPKDEVSLLRIINVPARGIGDVTVEKLTGWAREQGVGILSALERAESCPELTPGTAAKVAEFVALLSRYRERLSHGDAARVAHDLLAEIGFRESARLATASLAAVEKRLQSVDQLLTSIAAYERREAGKVDLLRYLNRLSLDTREEEDGPQSEQVTLMTLHAAKGLEYRCVFLIGMEEGLLPHGGMQGEPQNLEEERRLCYVGITRAKETLYLTRAAGRVKRGKLVERTPSRFLEDIPKSLVELRDLAAPPQGEVTEKERNFFMDLKAKLQSADRKT
jgi:DNA helicase-2/ATP-dependent DNA helicase PcrA